jgi:hypothetical protein
VVPKQELGNQRKRLANEPVTEGKRRIRKSQDGFEGNEKIA